jgi:hypothetical protein
MIQIKRVPYVGAIVVAGTVLAIFLGAPGKSMAQSGLNSTQSSRIAEPVGADSLWADMTAGRWKMNFHGSPSSDDVIVAAWPCFYVSTPGCIPYSNASFAEAGLTLSTIQNTFLQAGSSAPTWSSYVMPSTVTGCGGSSLVSDGATGFFCGPVPVRLDGATSGASSGGGFTGVCYSSNCLLFALPSNTGATNYTVDCDLYYSSTSTSGGISLQFTYSGSSLTYATFGGSIAKALSSTANYGVAQSSTSPIGPITGGAANAVSTLYPIHVSGTIELPATDPGNLEVQYENSGSAGTVTVARGSWCQATLVLP